MASMLVASLKRLYKGGKLTLEQMGERVEKGTISPEEYQDITGEEYAPQ